MIIIDSRAAKIKKIVIIVSIAAVVIAAVWLAVTYFGEKMEERMLSSQETNQAGKGDGGEYRNVSEIEAKFDQDREMCFKTYNNLENMSTEEVKELEGSIVELNPEKSKDYYFCLSLKNNNKQYCEALEADADVLKTCQNRLVMYSQFLFQSLRENKCDERLINVCKNAGGSDCESSCRGLVLKEVEECDNISDTGVKSACLAINKDDKSICNSLDQDGAKNCQELFYFLKAVRENNPSYLDKIGPIAFRYIAKLYFDSNSQCEKILAGFGKDACEKKFSRDNLKELEKQSGQQ